MIKINLLPYREERRKITLARQTFFLVIVVGVFLFLLGSVHTVMVLSVKRAEKKVIQAEKILLELQSITGDLEKFKKDKEIVEKKLNIIDNLEKNRHFTVKLLTVLAKELPSGSMWLTLLDEQETNLRIEGVARDNETIAHYMTGIEKTPIIESVDLLSSQQTIISGEKLKSFKIACRIREGA